LERTLSTNRREKKKKVATHLYGQEINAETYAIAKADLLLKGEGEAADNLVGGPEHSTLSADAFHPRSSISCFPTLLWEELESDLERMVKRSIKDPRFVITTAMTTSFR